MQVAWGGGCRESLKVDNMLHHDDESSLALFSGVRETYVCLSINRSGTQGAALLSSAR